ncbi:MAG: hypothetical protein GXP47_05450, partial [Acidobacteria bacterium]|nr:hypothetical protein [Acidobacteriota bacterium]
MGLRIKTRHAINLGIVVAVISASVFVVRAAGAIPAFARKYNVRCFMCHTVYPRLNRFGYEFKRLGYRMPPGWNGKKAPTSVRLISSHIPFKLTNAAAFFIRTDLTWLKDTAPDGTSTSTSSINLAEASLLFGGPVPN